MRGLHQAREFGGGNHRDIPGSFSAHDDHFLVFHYAVQNAGQIVTQVRIAGFGRHAFIVQDSCTSWFGNSSPSGIEFAAIEGIPLLDR